MLRPLRHQRGALVATLVKIILGLVILAALYVWFVWSWSYSRGERAGWVQKLSNKGFVCKTWEGELAMISMPGAAPEKFFFTVWSDEVAESINKSIGKRVALHYEEKVGLPGSCFGDTRYYVTRVSIVDEIPLGPGVVVPVPNKPAPGADASGQGGNPNAAIVPPPSSTPSSPASASTPPQLPPIPGSVPPANLAPSQAQTAPLVPAPAPAAAGAAEPGADTGK